MKQFAKSPDQAAAAGFTLVEALVALAILSLLLATVFGSLRVTSRSWDTATRHSENNEAMRLGIDFLRRQIEQAIPLRVSDGEEERLMFTGESERLRLASPLPMHAGGASIHWLTFEVAEAVDGGRNLMVSYGPVDALIELPAPTSADPAGMEQISAIDDIDGVTFHYYGRIRGSDAPRWHDEWNHESRFPELVRITVHAGNGTQQWPVLLIPLRAESQPPRPPFVVNVRSSKAEQPES